jgi:hypothetical protein
MWEADPKLFFDWIQKNQPKILEYLAENNVVKKITDIAEEQNP